MNLLTLINGKRQFVRGVDFLDFISGAFRTRLTSTPTADRTITLPNISGTVVLDTTISSQAAASRVLVCARQNTGVASASVEVSIPFSTEILDSQNLFTNGSFTPTSTALYRISVRIESIGSSYHTVEVYLFQGATKIRNIIKSYIQVWGCVSGFIDLSLTANTAYSIRGVISVGDGMFAPSTDSTGLATMNTLTIEKLT